jgi:CRP/FNR family transcriptional regulator, cyclic AMP receptor protein
MTSDPSLQAVGISAHAQATHAKVVAQLRSLKLLQALAADALIERMAQDSFRRESGLLEDFTAAEARVLAQALLPIAAQRQQRLLSEGESGGWMLLVFEGTVDVTKTNPHGGQTRLGVVTEGAIIGEMSLLDGEPRFASATAISPVRAGVLTQAAVGVLIRDHPAVGAKLLVKLTQLLSARLRNTSRRLVSVLDGQPAGAVADVVGLGADEVPSMELPAHSG